MLEKSFAVLFFLKRPSPFRKGPWLVFLRITVDGIERELSLKRTWEKSRWVPRQGRAAGTKEDARSLNYYLDVIRAKVYDARTALIQKNEPITAQAIRDMVAGNAERRKMLLQIFSDFNANVRALVGKEYAQDTYEKFERIIACTKDFIASKYKLPDLNIHSLNMEFISSFYNWYRTLKNCSHNTTIKYLQMFKSVILQCVANRWLSADPFMNFEMSLREVDTTFLTKEELETIATKELTNERLATVRDIYVFCCLTSLAYIDVRQLKRSEVKIGVDGKLWIDKKRQKTKVPTQIPLLPLTLQILEKYKNDPRCSDDKLLPVYSNSTYNEYLKEIASLCGINKNLTSHTARHTFGTTVTISNGVPLQTVKRMMGHKRSEQTEHYSKIVPLKIAEDMDDLEKKLQQQRFLS